MDPTISVHNLAGHIVARDTIYRVAKVLFARNKCRATQQQNCRNPIMELKDIIVEQHLPDFDYFCEVLEYIHGLTGRIRQEYLWIVMMMMAADKSYSAFPVSL